MKIGIFGGTFNPIHIGHIQMIKKIKEKLHLDLVYFVPSYRTPDKKFEVEKINPKYRYEMVVKSIKAERLKWLKVSDFEYLKKKTSYTFKTIKHFKETFSKDELYWIMGEDRYKGFNNWRNVEFIKKNCNIVIYRRNKEINLNLKENKEVIYLYDDLFDISSTKILNLIEWKYIPEAIKPYISKRRLYLKTLAFNVLREKRYEHSIAVASHAKRLSKEYGYIKSSDAWYAGVIHDLFKLHDIEFLKKYINKWDINNEFDLQNIPDNALHGFVAALWMREEYKWNNKKIFDSIASHTLSKPNTTKIDKILYVADKISTDRKGDKVGKLRKLAYKNLDLTYNKILKNLINKLDKKNIKVHDNTIKAYRENVDPRFRLQKYEFNLKKNIKKIKQ